MLKCLLNLVAGCTLLVAPVAYPADQAAAAPPVEYELVNDFAARLQTHLQQTGKILGQLRQTSDPGERQKLMNAYLAAVRTTAHITHTMQQLLDGGKGMAGEPKMGGMMKGGKCSCGMMRERASGKTSEAAPNPPAARDDSANRPAPDVEGEGDSDEHEGHH